MAKGNLGINVCVGDALHRQERAIERGRGRPASASATEGHRLSEVGEFRWAASVERACDRFLASPCRTHSYLASWSVARGRQDRPRLETSFGCGSGTTVADLEQLFGRKLYGWESDLWTIAGWTGSRRFLSI